MAVRHRKLWYTCACTWVHDCHAHTLYRACVHGVKVCAIRAQELAHKQWKGATVPFPPF